MYQIGAVSKDDAVKHRTKVASHTAVPLGTAKWLVRAIPTHGALPLGKGHGLTMSPTQGQAVIIGAIPYQPFRNTQGRFCMAGYHCLMLNSIICANHPYLIHLAPFCWQSFVRCLWHHFFAIGHPNIIPFCNVLLLLGITNARARYTRISNSS